MNPKLIFSFKNNIANKSLENLVKNKRLNNR